MAARSENPTVHEIAMAVLAAAVSNPKLEMYASRTSLGAGQLRAKLAKEAYGMAKALLREGEKH